MSKEPKSLLARAFADPWRKLVSLLLAIGLWFYLDAQVTKEDSLVLPIRPVDFESTGGQAGTPGTLELRISLRTFTIHGFEDEAGKSIDSVTLDFKGPSHVIRRLADDPSFSVTPTEQDLALVDGSWSFDKSRVRAANELLQGHLTAMHPPRVKVLLERNAVREVRLTPDNVTVVPPPVELERDFLARVEVDRARFFPETVILRGTTSALSRISPESPLFRADLSAFANTTQSEIRVTLRPLDELVRAGIRTDPRTIHVTYPVRPQYLRFELQVPVLLSLEGTPFSAEQWEPPEPQKIVLWAAGPLEAELSNKTTAELREWAKANAVIVARLAEPTELKTQTTHTRFLLYNETWREGRDYRAEVPALFVNPRNKSR